MSDPEAIEGVVIVADDGKAVYSYGDGIILPNIIISGSPIVHGGFGRAGAASVFAASHLEIAVVGVIVADDGQTVYVLDDRSIPGISHPTVHNGVGSAGTFDIVAASHIELAIGSVIVADYRAAAAAYGNRGMLLPDISPAAGNRMGGEAIGGIAVYCVLLLNEAQKQQRTIGEHERTIEAHESVIATLLARVEQLEQPRRAESGGAAQ